MGPPLFEVTNYIPMEPSSPWQVHLRTDYGETIPSLTDWENQFQHVYLYQGAIHEDFLTAFRKKLPDGNYCYGWIRYRVDAGDDISGELGTITFYEYCYCTTPNYPFHVGQTSLDWNSSKELSDLPIFDIFPNPTTGTFSLTGENISYVEVYDSTGQRITSLKGNGDKTTINLNSQPTGLYFVTVTNTEGRRYVKKIVKR